MLLRVLYDFIPGQDSQTVVNIRLLLRHRGPVKPARGRITQTLAEDEIKMNKFVNFLLRDGLPNT